jgi:hypothetical protein
VEVLEANSDVVVASATSAADGAYTTTVPVGTYDVRVRIAPAAGAGGVRPQQVIAGVAITTATSLRIVTLPDPARVHVRGFVRDAAGNGIGGVGLWFRQGAGGNIYSTAPEFSGDMRAPGSFDLMVPGGHYDFVLSDAVRQPNLQVAFPLELSSDLSFEFRFPTQDVAVTVVGTDGAPVPGVTVAPDSSSAVDVQVTPTIIGKGTAFRGGVTNASGVATFRSFVTTSPLTLRPGGVLPGGATSTTLTVPPTFAVRGVVRDAADHVVPGAQVMLSDRPTSASDFRGPLVSTTTNAAGEYTLRRAAGAYRVIAVSSGGSSLFVGADVDLVDADATHDFAFPSLSPVTVLVRGEDGNPAANVSVTAFSSTTATPTPPTGPSVSASAITGATGTAVLQLLPGVATRFNARPAAGFAANEVVLPASGPIELHLPTLVPVTGVARFDGAPIAGAKVDVQSGSGRVSVTADSSGAFATRAPAGDGSIWIDGFPGTATRPSFSLNAPLHIGPTGRDIALDVPAAHVEFRGAGIPFFAANLSGFNSSFGGSPGFGFPLADGLASGQWFKSVVAGSDGRAVVTVLPAPVPVSAFFESRSSQVSFADGDLVVFARLFADDAAPTITAHLSPTPGPSSGGWNQSAATVSFTCTDDLDPFPTCPPAVTVTGDTAGTVVERVAVDRAGNRAKASVVVKIDSSQPTIDTSSTSPMAPAWTNADAPVRFDCADALSGIAACPADAVASGEGAGIQVLGQAVDRAGNATSATATFNIDRTVPSITSSADPAATWTNSTTTVSFGCSDGLSGIASCPSPLSFSDEGVHPFSATAFDRAGNSAPAGGTVRIDLTPPTAVPVYPAGASSGWYRGPVVVGLACSDALSGVASCGTTTFNGAGLSQARVVRATDVAGNFVDVPVTVSVDAATPETTVPSRQAVVGKNKVVQGTATDALSGVARVTVRYDGHLGTTTVAATVACGSGGCTWTAPPPPKAGAYMVTATAVDVAGNVDATPATGTLITA